MNSNGALHVAHIIRQREMRQRLPSSLLAGSSSRTNPTQTPRIGIAFIVSLVSSVLFTSKSQVESALDQKRPGRFLAAMRPMPSVRLDLRSLDPLL